MKIKNTGCLAGCLSLIVLFFIILFSAALLVQCTAEYENTTVYPKDIEDPSTEELIERAMPEEKPVEIEETLEPAIQQPITEDVQEEPIVLPQKESFKNCTEMRKVYPNGVEKNHPAYDTKHDRDNDNWACEK